VVVAGQPAGERRLSGLVPDRERRPCDPAGSKDE
jgi:hypothetical protein